MFVRVLGRVGVGDTVGAPCPPLGSRSQRLILAVLAARNGETVSADVLVDALWGDDPPRTADHTLRTYVSRLRSVLGDALVIGPGGYALVVSSDQLDAARFESLTAEAHRAADPAATVQHFDEALGLWSGPAFGELADVGALRGAGLRLEELRLAAVEARAGALLRTGDPSGAIAAAEELLAAHPLREGAWAVLVSALAAASRTRDALNAYQRASEALAEAGLVPSPAGIAFPDLAADMAKVAARGFGVAVHAMGNAGLESTLEAFAAVARRDDGDRRFRVEHATLASPAQLTRLAELGGVAVVQPGFLPQLGSRVSSLGFDDATWMPFADLVRAGVPIAASSDHPCGDWQPLAVSCHGATRWTGREALGPEQALTYEDWLRAWTAGSAYAGGQEHERGRLVPGLRADLVILDGALDPDHPPTVSETWVAGRRCYAA